MPELVLLILEILGTVSFSVSGSIVAVRARLDLFGVCFISVVTSFGGGILRDMLIGKYPPWVFQNFYLVLISVAASVIFFVIIYLNRKKFDILREKVEYVNNFFDAVGLAAFCVMGTETAFAEGFAENMFFSVSLGTLTGIGGGMLRDILTDSTPYVLKKHVYAVAAIAGSLLYYLLRCGMGSTTLPSVLSMLLIVATRVLAARYRWSFPKISLKEPE